MLCIVFNQYGTRWPGGIIAVGAINNYVPVVLTGQALLTAIELERRKELVGEGHRFLDLKRTSRTVVRLTNCANFCSLGPAAREWVFPIPQAEILANKQMVQNDGY